MTIKDLDININDNSVLEFSDQVVEQLEFYLEHEGFFGFSDLAYHTQLGRKEMLKEIIEYIKLVKPSK